MKVGRIAFVAGAGTVAFVIALTLTGVGNGVVLLGYILFLAALAVVTLVARLSSVLPLEGGRQRPFGRGATPQADVEQFETIKRRIAIAGCSEMDLHSGFRPLVREIVAARLYRRYGIRLEDQPERAAAVIGDTRVWELVRPQRQPPADRSARGWSEREFEQVVNELENM